MVGTPQKKMVREMSIRKLDFRFDLSFCSCIHRVWHFAMYMNVELPKCQFVAEMSPKCTLTRFKKNHQNADIIFTTIETHATENIQNQTENWMDDIRLTPAH